MAAQKLYKNTNSDTHTHTPQEIMQIGWFFCWFYVQRITFTISSSLYIANVASCVHIMEAREYLFVSTAIFSRHKQSVWGKNQFEIVLQIG